MFLDPSRFGKTCHRQPLRSLFINLPSLLPIVVLPLLLRDLGHQFLTKRFVPKHHPRRMSRHSFGLSVCRPRCSIRSSNCRRPGRRYEPSAAGRWRDRYLSFWRSNRRQGIRHQPLDRHPRQARQWKNSQSCERRQSSFRRARLNRSRNSAYNRTDQNSAGCRRLAPRLMPIASQPVG